MSAGPQIGVSLRLTARARGRPSPLRRRNLSTIDPFVFADRHTSSASNGSPQAHQKAVVVGMLIVYNLAARVTAEGRPLVSVASAPSQLAELPNAVTEELL
jgi:hypothetical protein